MADVPSRRLPPDPLIAIGRGRERPEVEALAEFTRLAAAGRPVALVTVVGAEGSAPRGMGASMAVREDGSIVGTIGGGGLELLGIEHALEALRDGRPRRFHYDFSGGPRQNLDKACAGKTDLFVQPCPAQPELIVFGAGHIGSALAPMARSAGFRVTVADDRPGFPNPELLPADVHRLHGEYPGLIDRLQIDASSYIVIVTHGHVQDETVLAGCLRRPWRYLGMIGSRAKVARLFRNLSTDDEARAAIDRVHAPIGLDLGGRSPGEIAISILAEMLLVRYGKTEARSMRHQLRERAGNRSAARAGHGPEPERRVAPRPD